MTMKLRKPVKAGPFFKRRYIDTNEGLTLKEVAKGVGTTETTLKSFIEGNTKVNLNLACRLSHYTDTNASFWLNMQRINDEHVANGGGYE